MSIYSEKEKENSERKAIVSSLSNLSPVVKNFSTKFKKLIIFAFIIWGLFAFGLGSLISWFFIAKVTLDKFPEITANDRILVVAPHIDDEIISAGGLIQKAKSVGAQVKVVYLTNGDNNIYSIIGENKNLKINPGEFIKLGEQRMNEARAATQILGLKEEDLYFLGYPDGGLSLMLNKFYTTPYTSRGTKFNYNPYEKTYKKEQLYTGANVVSDLEEIISGFNPTIIIVPHPRDQHPDHWATFQFIEKALKEKKFQTKIFAYLVHYKAYPPEHKLKMDEFLYPPKKLFSQKGWVSFNLTQDQENKKLEAMNQNKTQLEFSKVNDLIQSFVKRNEIFEEIE